MGFFQHVFDLKGGAVFLVVKNIAGIAQAALDINSAAIVFTDNDVVRRQLGRVLWCAVDSLNSLCFASKQASVQLKKQLLNFDSQLEHNSQVAPQLCLNAPERARLLDLLVQDLMLTLKQHWYRPSGQSLPAAIVQCLTKKEFSYLGYAFLDQHALEGYAQRVITVFKSILDPSNRSIACELKLKRALYQQLNNLSTKEDGRIELGIYPLRLVLEIKSHQVLTYYLSKLELEPLVSPVVSTVAAPVMAPMAAPSEVATSEVASSEDSQPMAFKFKPTFGSCLSLPSGVENDISCLQSFYDALLECGGDYQLLQNKEGSEDVLLQKYPVAAFFKSQPHAEHSLHKAVAQRMQLLQKLYPDSDYVLKGSRQLSKLQGLGHDLILSEVPTLTFNVKAGRGDLCCTIDGAGAGGKQVKVRLPEHFKMPHELTVYYVDCPELLEYVGSLERQRLQAHQLELLERLLGCFIKPNNQLEERIFDLGQELSIELIMALSSREEPLGLDLASLADGEPADVPHVVQDRRHQLAQDKLQRLQEILAAFPEECSGHLRLAAMHGLTLEHPKFYEPIDIRNLSSNIKSLLLLKLLLLSALLRADDFLIIDEGALKLEMHGQKLLAQLLQFLNHSLGLQILVLASPRFKTVWHGETAGAGDNTFLQQSSTNQSDKWEECSKVQTPFCSMWNSYEAQSGACGIKL